MADLGSARVLVTGATGLIGTNLVRRLAALGSDVGAVVRPGTSTVQFTGLDVRILTADLSEAPAVASVMRDFGPTFVVSAAMPTGHACTSEQRKASVAVGLLATARLLDIAVEARVRRFVHVGSSLEYGLCDRPLREDDALEPTTFRGAVKAAASLLCLQRARAEELSAVVVRPFSVYGPWERRGRLVPAALNAALDGGSLSLTAEDYVRDFVFVDDVVDGIIAALSSGEEVSGRAINLGTGVQTANGELVRIVESVTGRPITVQQGSFPRRPGDTHHWAADTTVARTVLGWTARTDLTSGLLATARWMQGISEA